MSFGILRETSAMLRSFIFRMKSILFIVLIFTGLLQAQEPDSFLPQTVEISDFTAVQIQSPFFRSLNLSDSLILTGVAEVDDEQVATLLNKETNETFVVSSQLNSQGWKMVELKSDPDLEKVAAKVSVEGGEVVTIRYSEIKLKPGQTRPGGGPPVEAQPEERGRGKGDGRRGPPTEMREKMGQLSEAQRGKLFEKMREFREKNPDMPREDMGKLMMETMNKMTQK
jgi:hypothetical protein